MTYKIYVLPCQDVCWEYVSIITVIFLLSSCQSYQCFHMDRFFISFYPTNEPSLYSCNLLALSPYPLIPLSFTPPKSLPISHTLCPSSCTKSSTLATMLGDATISSPSSTNDHLLYSNSPDPLLRTHPMITRSWNNIYELKQSLE